MDKFAADKSDAIMHVLSKSGIPYLAHWLLRQADKMLVMMGIFIKFNGDQKLNLLLNLVNIKAICDHPQENRPSSHLEMIVEIQTLFGVTSFCSC